jgi:TM2 domain-containing membrane protein YozV
MYKVIGSDGRQYGPVGAEQVRRWLAENRLNAQSLVCPDGAADWKPLSMLPEFAADFAAPPPASPSGPPPLSPPLGQTAHARASNKVAAGVCGILLGALGVHKFILGYTGAGLIMLLLTVLSCGILAWIVGIVGLIEGIIYLTRTDEDFVRQYVDSRREWF